MIDYVHGGEFMSVTSNKGYTPSNLWFVTWWVNSMKMDMPMITFWKRVDTLAESRKTRKEEYANKARY